jgi:hypothetical protein
LRWNNRGKRNQKPKEGKVKEKTDKKSAEADFFVMLCRKSLQKCATIRTRRKTDKKVKFIKSSRLFKYLKYFSKQVKHC